MKEEVKKKIKDLIRIAISVNLGNTNMKSGKEERQIFE
jgi:hypothetical protein